MAAGLERAARRLTAGGLAVAGLAVGCGGDEPPPVTQSPAVEREPAAAESPAEPAPKAVAKVRCPDGLAGCEQASGTILYVERVDPDGDGDAHFVLASTASITAPGISVIDVEANLRPRPLPRPGDALAAAGPVYEGSYGQRQIQATGINFERAP